MNESHLINEHLHLGKQEPQSVSLGLAEYFLMEVPKMQGPSWDLSSKLEPDCICHCHQVSPTQKLTNFLVSGPLLPGLAVEPET